VSGVSRHFADFRPRTLRTQNISAPSDWCRSVRTVRQQCGSVSRTLRRLYRTVSTSSKETCFATIGRTEESFNITRWTTDFIDIQKIHYRADHLSGAENGAERAEKRVERVWQKTMGWEVAEREWSGERAESATHSPLQPNISRHWVHNVCYRMYFPRFIKIVFA